MSTQSSRRDFLAATATLTWMGTRAYAAGAPEARQMRIGILEGFRMWGSNLPYGLTSENGRTSLFSKAAKLGFQGIELGIGTGYREDSLWTGKGNARAEIRAAAHATGVEAASICLHVFTHKEHNPFADWTVTAAIIRNAIEASAAVGAKVILLPFFGAVALKPERINEFIEEMKKLHPIAKDHGVCLGLETSLSAARLVPIVETIGSDFVKAYFDTGNALQLKYDVIREIEGLGRHIAQVHIKDHPATRMLGQGSVDFRAVIVSLKKMNFEGYLMLETPSTSDSGAAAAENLAHIKKTMGPAQLKSP